MKPTREQVVEWAEEAGGDPAWFDFDMTEGRRFWQPIEAINSFAVFEIKDGDECEQITVWLPLRETRKYLYDWRKRCPACHYLIFERHNI